MSARNLLHFGHFLLNNIKGNIIRNNMMSMTKTQRKPEENIENNKIIIDTGNQLKNPGGSSDKNSSNSGE